MDIAFRPTPNGTIRLTAVTAQGAAPVLANLPAGSGCTVMIWNRGTVPVSVAFGRNAAMDLPALPTDTVGGARTIPAGAATLQRLQQGERHVAIAASGTPDVEFTVGEGGSDVFAIPGAGGAGGGGGDATAANQQKQINALGAPTDSASAAGADTSIIGALRAIRDKVLGVLTFTPAQPDTVDTYTITGTGSTVGIPLKGYGSVLAELMGTFNLTGVLQFSTDTTDGVDGTWTDGFGFLTENSGGTATTTTLTSTTRKRYYRADGTWVRFNALSFVSGTATVKIMRKAAPISERAVNVGGGVIALLPSTNVVGSTTLRATGTNRSTTVGTTASTLMASNSTRQGWKIKNDTTGDIWINFDTTASAAAGGGNFKIAAGGFAVSEPGFVETGAMSVIGSAASLAITAREY